MSFRTNSPRKASASQIPSGSSQVDAGRTVQFGTKPQEIRDQAQGSARVPTPMPMARDVREVTESMVAQRAYEIWQSQGGSELDNWLKAERELRERYISAMQRASR